MKYKLVSINTWLKDNLERNIKIFSYLIYIILSCILVYDTIIHSIDAPYQLDDARVILQQYETRYLSGESNILEFLLKYTLYPHSKLVLRALTLSSILLSGTVHFHIFQILGSFVTCISLFIFYKYSRINSPLVLIPSALILLKPTFTINWITPITGYPYMFLMAFLVFYFIRSKRLILACVFAFIVGFTHSPGVLISLLGLMYLSLRIWMGREDKFKFFIYFLLTAIIFYCYYYFILRFGGMVTREHTSIIPHSINEVYSNILYFCKFVFLPFSGLVNSLHSGILVFIGFMFFSILLYLFLKTRQIEKYLPLWFSLVYTLAIGAAITLVNDNSLVLTDNVWPRYQMYAVYLLTFAILLLNTFFKKTKYLILLNLALSIVLLPIYLADYHNSKRSYIYRSYSWAHLYSGDLSSFNPKDTRKKRLHEIVNHAQNIGIYNPMLLRGYEVESENNIELNAKNGKFKFEIISNAYSDNFYLIEIGYVASKNLSSNVRILLIDSLNSKKYTFKLNKINPNIIKRRNYKYKNECKQRKCTSNTFRIGLIRLSEIVANDYDIFILYSDGNEQYKIPIGNLEIDN